MRYILAIFLPPFALLGCGKPFQFILNLSFWIVSLFLWLAGIFSVFFLPVLGGMGFFVWLLCTFHAVIVCGARERNKQMDRLVSAIESRSAVPAISDQHGV